MINNLILQAIFYPSIYLVFWQKKKSERNKTNKYLFIMEILALVLFFIFAGTFNLIPTTILELGVVVLSLFIIRSVLKK